MAVSFSPSMSYDSGSSQAKSTNKFQCHVPGCTGSYKYKGDLKTHILWNHGREEVLKRADLADKSIKVGKPFPCPHPRCQSGYNRGMDLLRHLYGEDVAGFIETREALDEMTIQVEQIWDHFNSMPVQGPWESFFQEHEALEASLFEIDGEHRYRCDIDRCAKSFAMEKDLRVHIKKKHGQQALLSRVTVKFFQCPFADCAESFYRRAGLTRHVRNNHINK